MARTTTAAHADNTHHTPLPPHPHTIEQRHRPRSTHGDMHTKTNHTVPRAVGARGGGGCVVFYRPQHSGHWAALTSSPQWAWLGPGQGPSTGPHKPQCCGREQENYTRRTGGKQVGAGRYTVRGGRGHSGWRQSPRKSERWVREPAAIGNGLLPDFTRAVAGENARSG